MSDHSNIFQQPGSVEIIGMSSMFDSIPEIYFKYLQVPRLKGLNKAYMNHHSRLICLQKELGIVEGDVFFDYKIHQLMVYWCFGFLDPL